ncbi:MAG: hypothetical protein K2H15_07900, partial [Muribaculaceae bacterium]|nr:hypothetical protein [Muribaculaceae bacterium]
MYHYSTKHASANIKTKPLLIKLGRWLRQLRHACALAVMCSGGRTSSSGLMRRRGVDVGRRKFLRMA